MIYTNIQCALATVSICLQMMMYILWFGISLALGSYHFLPGGGASDSEGNQNVLGKSKGDTIWVHFALWTALSE